TRDPAASVRSTRDGHGRARRRADHKDRRRVRRAHGRPRSGDGASHAGAGAGGFGWPRDCAGFMVAVAAVAAHPGKLGPFEGHLPVNSITRSHAYHALLAVALLA